MAYTPPDMLAEIGRALYGEHWRLSLARGLVISDETIRRWMTGRVVLPPDHGAFRDALALLDRRVQELAIMRGRLAAWMEGPPSPEVQAQETQARRLAIVAQAAMPDLCTEAWDLIAWLGADALAAARITDPTQADEIAWLDLVAEVAEWTATQADPPPWAPGLAETLRAMGPLQRIAVLERIEAREGR